MDLSLDDLTIGDLEEIEQITGQSSDKILNGGMPSAKALKAIVFVTHRKQDPDFTLEDAAAVKVTSIDIGDDDPPTDGGA